jgi:hypothetical protein
MLPGGKSGAPPPPPLPQEPTLHVDKEEEEEDKDIFADLPDDGEAEEGAAE